MKAVLPSPGERGPKVLGRGPLPGHTLGSSPEGLTPTYTPLPARSSARWGGSGSWPLPQLRRPRDLSSWDPLACPSEVTLPPSPQKPRPLTLIKNKPNKIWKEKNPPQTASEMIVCLPNTHTYTHARPSFRRARLQPGFHVNKLLESAFVYETFRFPSTSLGGGGGLVPRFLATGERRGSPGFGGVSSLPVGIWGRAGEGKAQETREGGPVPAGGQAPRGRGGPGLPSAAPARGPALGKHGGRRPVRPCPLGSRLQRRETDD